MATHVLWKRATRDAAVHERRLDEIMGIGVTLQAPLSSLIPVTHDREAPGRCVTPTQLLRLGLVEQGFNRVRASLHIGMNCVILVWEVQFGFRFGRPKALGLLHIQPQAYKSSKCQTQAFSHLYVAKL